MVTSSWHLAVEGTLSIHIFTINFMQEGAYYSHGVGQHPTMKPAIILNCAFRVFQNVHNDTCTRIVIMKFEDNHWLAVLILDGNFKIQLNHQLHMHLHIFIAHKI